MIRSTRRIVEIVGWWTVLSFAVHWAGIRFPSGGSLLAKARRSVQGVDIHKEYTQAEGMVKSLTARSERAEK